MGAFPFQGQTLELFQPVESDPLAASEPAGVQAPFAASGEVVAVADHSPDGAHAVDRAALIARALGRTLHLVYAAGSARNLASAQARLDDLAREARERWGLRTACHVVDGGAAKARELLATLAPRPMLVVLPALGQHALGDFLFGTQAERILRALGVPVLVARRPAWTDYRRVLVPAKLDDDAVFLVTAARSVARRPRISVLHVLDTSQERSLRVADVPEPALRMQRQRRCGGAWLRLQQIIDRAGAGESATAQVSFGDPCMRVLEAVRATHAQLVVAGLREKSLPARWLAAGTVRRLVQALGVDVLLVPLPHVEVTRMADPP